MLKIFIYLVPFLCFNLAAKTNFEPVVIKTFAKENPTVTFRCRAPAKYQADSAAKCRLLVYFGGRNTTGEGEVKNRTWTNWCDRNGIFLIVPSYKNDNYWEPQKWSGKALLEAIAQLKKKYPNICDDKLLFYGYSAGASGSGSGSSSTTESGGPYATYDECVAALNATRTNTGRGEYTDSMRVETTPEQDAQAKVYADEYAGDSYWLIGYNCQDYVEGMLDEANVDYDSTLIPSDFIPENKGNGVWE